MSMTQIKDTEDTRLGLGRMVTRAMVEYIEAKENGVELNEVDTDFDYGDDLHVRITISSQNGELADIARQVEDMRTQSDSEALNEAKILIDEIMKGEVNPEDEAEKWLRAFAPEYLRPND